ncbi:MAG: hypothetical protein WC712_02220 [Candidatus Brocadiia bacterium]
MSETIGLVFRYLDSLRGRMKRQDIAVALNFTIAFLVLSILAGVVGDHLIGLPATFRAVYLALIVCSAAGALFFGVVRPLFRRLSYPYCARFVEKAVPTLEGNLISLAELPDRTTPVAGALAERSFERVSQIPPSSLVPQKPLFVSFSLVGLAIVLFAAYATFAPKSAFESLRRILSPASAIAAPTSTRIVDVLPGNARALEGSRIAFKVRTAGSEPSSARIVRQIKNVKETLDLQRTETHTFEGVLPAAMTGFSYYVYAGDAVKGPFQLRILPAPIVKSFALKVTPPAYTEIPEFTDSSPVVRVPQGSTVVAQLATTTDIRSAKLLDGRREVPFDAISGRSASLEIQISGDQKFAAYYTDVEGFSSALSASISITVIPDRTPEVKLELPTDGASLPFNVPLVISGSASDDYGLTKLAILYRLNGVDIAPGEISTDKRSIKVWKKISPADAGWKVGDKISVAITATDNRDPDPQAATTEYHTVTIAEPASDLNQPGNPANNPDKAEGDKAEDQTEKDPRDKIDDMKGEDKKAIDDIQKKLDGQPKEEDPNKKKPEDPPKTGPEKTPKPTGTEEKPPTPSPSLPPSPSPSPSPTLSASPRPSPQPSGSPQASPAPTGSAEPGNGNNPQPSTSPAPSTSQQPGNGNNPQPSTSPAPSTSQEPGNGNNPQPSASPAPQGSQQPGNGNNPQPSGSPTPSTSQQPGNGNNPQPSASPAPQGSQQPGNGNDPQPSGAPAPSGSPAPGNQPGNDPGNQPGGNQPGGNQPGGNQPGGNQPGGDQPGGNQPGGNQPGGNQPGGNQPGGSQPGGNQPGGNQPGGNQPGGNQPGGNQPGGNQPGGGQNGGGQPGGGGTKHEGDGPDTAVAEFEKFLDRVDQAIKDGKISEAELEKEGLGKERRDEYRRLIRQIKIKQMEAKGMEQGDRHLEGGSTSGKVGATGPNREDKAKDATGSQATGDNETVSGGYRSLIEAYRKSTEEQK